MSLLWVKAMAWHNRAGTAEEARARPVGQAGFKGYVGRSDWADWEDYEEDSEEPGFDEDLWDAVRPEPTKAEQRELDRTDESDSHWKRHEQAYADALNKRRRESFPDIHDDELHEFIGEHGSDTPLWQNKARLGPVDLSKGVYATQSHVGQTHIDHYLEHPDSDTWDNRTNPKQNQPQRIVEPSIPEGLRGPHRYLGDETPLFVTHEGRLHCIEGHHRVAAALQRGDRTIHAWHYDGDKHGLPGYDEDD